MKTLYGFSNKGKLEKGTMLFNVFDEGMEQTIIEDGEVLEMEGKTLLLRDKEIESYIGPVLEKGKMKYIYETSRDIISRDLDGNILSIDPKDWMHIGAQSNQGEILCMSDNLAVVMSDDGLKTVQKSSLHYRRSKKEMDLLEIEILNETAEMRKSVLGTRTYDWSNFKPQVPEGEERTPHKYLRRYKGKNGGWEYVYKDKSGEEYAGDEHGNKLPRHRNWAKGDRILFGEKEGRLVEIGDKINAIETDNGIKNIPASQIEKEPLEVKIEGHEQTEQPDEQEIHSANAENYIDKAKQSPKYQQWSKDMETKGWEKYGNFEYRKQKDDDRFGQINLRKIWNPLNGTQEFLFNDVPRKVKYDGKDYDLSDMDIDSPDLSKADIELRGEDGSIVKTKRDLIDKFRGQLVMGEDGNISVENTEGKQLGRLELSPKITQEDLFNPDIIKLIKDEVWGTTVDGDGAVIYNEFLGMIDDGIVVYRHGNEMGVITKGANGHVVEKSDLRRGKKGKPKNWELKDIQAEVQARADRYAKHRQAILNHGIIGARIEGLYPSEAKGNVSSNYFEPVFQAYLRATPDIEQEFLSEYGTPDFDNTAKRIGELMKTHEGKIVSDISSFNAILKRGRRKELPKEVSTEDYTAYAKSLMEEKVKTFRNDLVKRRKQEERTGELKDPFQRDEKSEDPPEGTLVSKKSHIIRDSRNKEYEVKDGFMKLSDIENSHDVEGKENPIHPYGLQARLMEGGASTDVMKKIAKSPKDELTATHADATRGGPTVYVKNGKAYVVAGNTRMAGIKAMSDSSKMKYLDMMKKKAKEIGIDPSKINRDYAYVRFMTPKSTYLDAKELAAFSQKSSARTETALEEAVKYSNVETSFNVKNVNMKGIGAKPITKVNVFDFAKDNPILTQEIEKASGMSRASLEADPELMARQMNAAMLSQLNPGFLKRISSLPREAHSIIETLVPTLLNNKLQTEKNAEGKSEMPIFANMENLLEQTIKSYSSNTVPKALLYSNKKGEIPFLTDEQHVHSLKNLMNQSDIFSKNAEVNREKIAIADQAKEANKFRDPLHNILLIAYANAMRDIRNEAGDPDKAQQSKNQTRFVLGMRRFGNALAEISHKKKEGGGLFGDQELSDEQIYQQTVKAAQETLLNGKPYLATDDATKEEQELSATAPMYDVYGQMKQYAETGKYGLASANDADKILNSPIGKREKIKESKAAVVEKSKAKFFAKIGNVFKSFASNFFNDQHLPEGTMRVFPDGGNRVFVQTPSGEKRWMLEEEATEYYSAMEEASMKKSQLSMFGENRKGDQAMMFPKYEGEERTPHKYLRRYKGKNGGWEYVYKDKSGEEYAGDEHGNKLPRHRNWAKGDRILFGEKEGRLVEIGDSVASLRDREGKKFTAKISDLKHSNEEQEELWDKPKDKWHSLLDELIADLEQGEQSKEYELANDKPELKRRISETERQIKNRESGKKESKEIIESHGMEYGGRQEPGYIDFKDPWTGSNLLIKEEQLNHENLEKKIKEGREKFASKPQEPGEIYNQRLGYRGSSDAGGGRHTAQEVVDYEADELGNEETRQHAQIAAEKHALDLSKVKPSDVQWITRNKMDAMRYTFDKENKIPEKEIEDYSPEEQKYLLEQIEEQEIPKGSVVLDDLGEDGVLLVHHPDEYKKKIAKSKAGSVITLPKDDLVSEHEKLVYILKWGSEKAQQEEADRQNAEFEEYKKEDSTLKDAIEEAGKQTDSNPSEAQIEAGNYKKGKVKLHGFEISIEKPKGSYREGKDKDGEPWKVMMKNPYGYILGTKGKDKEHLDVFIGDEPESEMVFIVNQCEPETKNFDEHKVIFGTNNEKEATGAYKSNYSDDASKRILSVAGMTIKQFKKWLAKESNMKKPAPMEEE